MRAARAWWVRGWPARPVAAAISSARRRSERRSGRSRSRSTPMSPARVRPISAYPSTCERLNWRLRSASAGLPAGPVTNGWRALCGPARRSSRMRSAVVTAMRWRRSAAFLTARARLRSRGVRRGVRALQLSESRGRALAGRSARFRSWHRAPQDWNVRGMSRASAARSRAPRSLRARAGRAARRRRAGCGRRRARRSPRAGCAQRPGDSAAVPSAGAAHRHPREGGSAGVNVPLMTAFTASMPSSRRIFCTPRMV